MTSWNCSYFGMARTGLAGCLLLALTLVACGESGGESDELGELTNWEIDDFSGALAVGPDGTPYLRSWSSPTDIYSLNRDTGETGWTLPIDGGASGVPLVAPDGTVYSIVDDDKIMAIDGDGSDLWTSDSASAELTGTLALGDDGLLFASSDAGNDARLLAFDLDDEASELWTFDADGGSIGSPVVDDANMVYFYAGEASNISADDHQVYAIDGSGDGESPEWTFDEGEEVTSIPLIGDGAMLYVLQDDVLYALDRETGEEQWNSPLGEDHEPKSMMVQGGDGTIYLTATVSTRMFEVLAIDPDSGEIDWNYEIGETQFAYTPCVADDGTVFVGTREPGHRLYALDSDDGTQKWSVETGIDTYVCLIDDDGTLYAGGTSGNAPGKLFSFDLDGVDGPADSPWPMPAQGPGQTSSVE